MNDPGRVKITHLLDQRWQEIRGARDEIERIAYEGAKSEDEELVKALFHFILAQMLIADYDLEEA